MDNHKGDRIREETDTRVILLRKNRSHRICRKRVSNIFLSRYSNVTCVNRAFAHCLAWPYAHAKYART